MATKEEVLEKLYGKEGMEKYNKRVAEERQKAMKRLEPEEIKEVLESAKSMDPETSRALWGEKDILLVETPNKITRREVGDSAVSIPMLWGGRWVSCLFNNTEVAEDVVENDLIFLVGKYSETKAADGSDRTFLNMRVNDIVRPE